MKSKINIALGVAVPALLLVALRVAGECDYTYGCKKTTTYVCAEVVNCIEINNYAYKKGAVSGGSLCANQSPGIEGMQVCYNCPAWASRSVWIWSNTPVCSGDPIPQNPESVFCPYAYLDGEGCTGGAES